MPLDEEPDPSGGQGSTIVSGARTGYTDLEPELYRHLSISQAAMKRAGLTHRVRRREACDVRRPLTPGVRFGCVSVGEWAAHHERHLDEFVFRQNRRLNLGAAFQTLLGLGTTHDATTYETITGTEDIQRVACTPSQKQTGTFKRRKKFMPAAPTMPANPDALPYCVGVASTGAPPGPQGLGPHGSE
jgi:hypothetical protein